MSCNAHLLTPVHASPGDPFIACQSDADTRLRVGDGCLWHNRAGGVAAVLRDHAAQVCDALLQHVRRVECRLHADLLQLVPAAVLCGTCRTATGRVGRSRYNREGQFTTRGPHDILCPQVGNAAAWQGSAKNAADILHTPWTHGGRENRVFVVCIGDAKVGSGKPLLQQREQTSQEDAGRKGV